MMGWFGLLYWAALGWGIRKMEGWFRATRTGLIISVLCYLPLLQLVMQDFWAGAMNASIVVFPVMALLKYTQIQPVRIKRRIRSGTNNLVPKGGSGAAEPIDPAK